MKRNLKNFNHWIAELRDIAKANGVQRIDDYTGEPELIPDSGIRKIFDKQSYQDDFESGYTPQDAFEFTIDAWQEC